MRKGRTAFVALVALLLPVLGGCEMKALTVEILGWDAYEVRGLWLWRWDETAGRYQRDNAIQFLRDRPTTEYASSFPSGTELVLYSYATGSSEIPVAVERSPSDPDRVRLKLWYLRFSEPGVFKATTYNAAGESRFSSNSVPL